MFIVLLLLVQLVAGVASLALLFGSLYVLWEWYAGDLAGVWWCVAGSLALLYALLGRHLVLALHRGGEVDPQRHGRGAALPGTRGCVLHMETDGAGGSPTLVLTHGWGFDASAWYYVRRRLRTRFHLVLWDLPGLGASRSFEDGVIEIERFADNLRLLAERTEGPVILVGHSIGGMTILTLCRKYPELLRAKVSGLVLIDTTYTQPQRTTLAASLWPGVQKPVAKALLQLNRFLWPLAWLMNWQGYLNGTTHLVSRLMSFSHVVTRGQLDFAARSAATAHPAVLAKGMLAALDWDETEALRHISVPVAVIVGDHDRLTLPRASSHIASTVPKGTLSRISPAGHSGLVERGDAYASAIAAAVDARMFELIKPDAAPQ